MKITTIKPLIGIAGKPFLDEGNVPMTYRAIIHSALNQSKQGEVIGAELSSQRYAILQKLYAGGTIDLTDAERQVIRDAMEGSSYIPEIRGLVNDFLDSDKAKSPEA